MEIDIIEPSQLPVNALFFFENSRRISVEKIPSFDLLAKISHRDIPTYIALIEKTYPHLPKSHREKIVFIYEGDNSNYIGKGEIRYAYLRDEEFFSKKPFVGYTYTHKSDTQQNTRRGFGTQRLILMNDLTHHFFDLPLHSSDLISNLAQRCWNILVEKKFAQEYLCENKRRFRFTSSSS